MDLAGAISEDPNRLTEAEDWYEHSQVYADRVHDPNGLLEAESLSTLAGIRKDQGELEQARELYSKARDIKAEALGERNSQTAVVTNNLALVLDRMGERDEAKRLFALFRDWLVVEFDRLGLGQNSAQLALHLLARSQGIATLSNTFQDRAFVDREVTAMCDWLDDQIKFCTSASS